MKQDEDTVSHLAGTLINLENPLSTANGGHLNNISSDAVAASGIENDLLKANEHDQKSTLNFVMKRLQGQEKLLDFHDPLLQLKP